jgi:hypothetical protein
MNLPPDHDNSLQSEPEFEAIESDLITTASTNFETQPEYQMRVQELSSHWKKAEVAAERIGWKKPEGVTWHDAAEMIARVEFERNLNTTATQATSAILTSADILLEPAVVSAPSKSLYPTTWYRDNGIPYCETCGEQYLTGNSNEPICPEQRAACPRFAAIKE